LTPKAKRRAWAAGAGAFAALPMALFLWRFTVDDALISARYAHHLATGVGYRFNAGGPSTDGVTPLGFAHLLAPFAAESVLAAYGRAKVMGLVAWLIGAASLGVAIEAMAGGRRRWAALGLVALSAPLGAWSVAGMETGVVMGLAAGAASARVLGRERLSAGLAGAVAAWRPEALAWAIVLALAPGTAPRRAHARWAQLALAVGPALAVAGARKIAFGRAAPLSLLAKTPDWVLGARYALAAAMLTGVIALFAVRELPGWVRGLQTAVLAHFAAIALAGGDWMPLSRLAVTALPTLVLAAAFIAGRGHALFAFGRLALAGAGLVFAAVKVAPRAAEVEPKRLAVVEQLRPALAGRRVAALDIGWVGAATDGDVLDLAGITDPVVAALPGGHTSKRIPVGLIEVRQIDALVLLLAEDAPAGDWPELPYGRWVEAHVAHLVGDRFTVTAKSDPPLVYVVATR
jgi:hypothetical protein